MILFCFRNVSIAALKQDAEFYGVQPLGKLIFTPNITYLSIVLRNIKHAVTLIFDV